jgi:uncharacterized protein YlxW (UPF0749 family)
MQPSDDAAQAPVRRRRSRWKFTRWQFGVVLVCLIAGMLLATARTYSQGKDISNRSVDLSAVVQDAEQRVQVADAQAAELQAQIDAAADGDISPQVESARAGVAALEPAAGLIPVVGPGLSVSMQDAPRDADGNYPDGVDPDDLVVHQQDVQSVVNAMWAGGAEAMMIMDQRVLTTSAVRCIGNTLLLQGRTYSPPFVVTAIGDAARMSAALDAEPGVRLLLQYVDKYKLGYEVSVLDSVTLPAYDRPVRLASAREGP